MAFHQSSGVFAPVLFYVQHRDRLLTVVLGLFHGYIALYYK